MKGGLLKEVVPDKGENSLEHIYIHLSSASMVLQKGMGSHKGAWSLKGGTTVHTYLCDHWSRTSGVERSNKRTRTAGQCGQHTRSTISTGAVGTIEVVIQSNTSGAVNSKSWTAVEDN